MYYEKKVSKGFLLQLHNALGYLAEFSFQSFLSLIWIVVFGWTVMQPSLLGIYLC